MQQRIVSQLVNLRAFAPGSISCAQNVLLFDLSRQRSISSKSEGKLLRRYRELVAQNALVPDAGQAACAARLSALADQLRAYTESLLAYRRDVEVYQEKRQAMRKRLKDEEERGAAKVKRGKAEGSGTVSLMTEWWRRHVLGENPPPQLRPEQRAILAATRREQRLDELLGLPVRPPAAPSGLYIYGDVGSGKSLLAGLFYQLIDEEARVPLRRHLHFNSAMMEVNSRIWGFEQQRISKDTSLAERTIEHQQLRGDQNGEPGKGAGARPERTRWQRKAEQLRPKLVARRNRMQMLRRAPHEHTEALARSNSVILTRAAQALIRGNLADADSVHGRQAALLYFDELQITDPFTAISLKALVEELVAEGAVVVITSNRRPDEMTNHGLHEALFDHFVQTLQMACDVVQLGSGTDYRRLGLSSQDGVAANFLHPLGAQTAAALEARWVAHRSQHPAAAAESVPVMFGRSVQLSADQVAGGAARFTFAQLCKTLMAAADYQALARRFHTLFVTGIPAMSFATRDQARRFILLVDELYNNKTALVCTAEAPPDLLFAGAESEESLVDLEALQFETAAEGGRLRRDVMAEGGLAPLAAKPGQAKALQAQLGGLEEQFAFLRAVSRLHEMQTSTYLQSRQHE